MTSHDGPQHGGTAGPYGEAAGHHHAPYGWHPPVVPPQGMPYGQPVHQPPPFAAPHGAPYGYGYPYVAPRRTNGLAIAGLVLGWIGVGILGLVLLAGIASTV